MGIRPSGQRQVVSEGGKIYVQSDGFMPADLLQINVAKLQEYLGDRQDMDFVRLWNKAVALAEGKTPTEAPKKVGRPKKEVTV